MSCEGAWRGKKIAYHRRVPKASLHLNCPYCDWSASSDAVTTDLAFAVLRARVVGHLRRTHGLAASDAGTIAQSLDWKARAADSAKNKASR